MNPTNPLSEDLDHILEHTEELWEEFRNQRIFITGGTGFFGCWLLESFAFANDKLKLNSSALVLSRNPEAFKNKAPHLFYHPAIHFYKGNVQNFEFPEGKFSHLIHCAVYKHPADEKQSNLSMVNEMLTGSRRVLDFCVSAKIKKMLLVSTGAVYGKASYSMKKIPEDFSGSFDPTVTSSAYHQIRRMMESLCVLYANENNFEVKIARCFSFIGPYLPIDGRFAAGDFLKDSLTGKRITIKGDGKSVRSYLYMADLAIWLWQILCRGISCKPYNVGSELPVTIKELADKIANQSDLPLQVSILNNNISGVAQDYYVPDTSRAQSELGLHQKISLQEAIRITMRWYKDHYSKKGELIWQE